MEKMVCELEEPYILCYEKKVGNIKEILPLLEKVAKAGAPLLMPFLPHGDAFDPDSRLLLNRVGVGQVGARE